MNVKVKTDYSITLLGILFIGLKLTGHIDWSWWWVLSPFWITIILIAIIVYIKNDY